MSRGHTPVGFVLPGEYRKPAERLFPDDGYSKGKNPDLKSAAAFAKSLGIDVDYQRLLSLDKTSGDLRAFLEHFQNNLDLLIQKTWVEKSDEKRKEHLQDRIPVFMGLIDSMDYLKAIDEFASILEELAFLFFGIQSSKNDFTEYTFRIDAQLGLFWWYGARLYMMKEKNKKISRDDKALWGILLIGLCYLTNF
ncbi:MAG: hypothetical protein LBI04_10750 [Treponema sp.]|jgi:hypothetical protein|nr:hypothetical protein [Treponema sp.]